MLGGILSGPFAWFADAYWNKKPQELPLIAWFCLVIAIVVWVHYSAFLQLDRKNRKLKAENDDLKAERLKIIPAVEHDNRTGYWRVRVKNTSKQAIAIGMKLVSIFPPVSTVPLPIHLQITHNAGVNELSVDADGDCLFDICDPPKRGHQSIRIIGVGHHPAISPKTYDFTVRAYSGSGRATDSHIFKIDEVSPGNWIVMSNQPTS
jgi:hypothetical protein